MNLLKILLLVFLIACGGVEQIDIPDLGKQDMGQVDQSSTLHTLQSLGSDKYWDSQLHCTCKATAGICVPDNGLVVNYPYYSDFNCSKQAILIPSGLELERCAYGIVQDKLGHLTQIFYAFNSIEIAQYYQSSPTDGCIKDRIGQVAVSAKQVDVLYFARME